MVKLFVTLLSLFVLSVSSTNVCNLQCPSSMDLTVGDKCVVAVPDLSSYITYDNDCVLVSQTGLGGYFPLGYETVTMTVKNDADEMNVCDISVKMTDTTKPVIETARMVPSVLFGTGKMMYTSLKLKTKENCCGTHCSVSVTVEDDGTYVPEGKTCEEAGAALGLSCSCRQGCAGSGCNAGQGLGFGGGKYCGTNVCCCEDAPGDCTKDEEEDLPIETEKTCLDLPMNEQYKVKSSRSLQICNAKNDENNDRTYHVTGKCVDLSGNESDEFSTKIVITNEPSQDADPTCANGVLDSKNEVCCSSTCGTCGGVGCSLRPGGEDECCTSKILQNAGSCANGPAPCVM